MLQKIFIFLTLFVSFFGAQSYANDLVFSDSTKTIRELKENIEGLDKAKEDLYIKIKDFAPDQKLKSYFREDLTLVDLENIRLIIDEYNKNKYVLEIELQEKSKQLLDTSDIRKKLLEEKKELYKKLTSFIKSSEYSNYLEYIKSDTTIYFEKKEIDSDIYRKQEILNNKVNILEEKIKEHRIYIEESLQKLVEGKMDEKLEFLKQNKNFSGLTNIQKVEVIEKTIIKTQTFIKSYEDEIQNSANINNNKKIEVYNIVLQKLEDFKNSYK
ncbi:MAG: hypothetical protein PHI37_01985 [Candidatus Gracilibacteria bacterium]|nr:hypothetical protein [Candidatus Gracilibacteria bacterium]